MTTNELTLKKLFNKELIITSRVPKVPLYVAVYDIIYGLIKNKELSEGDKIPTENFLSEYLAVSRSTVRMAILILQEDGFLYTRHGKGTYVASVEKSNGIHSRELSLTAKDIIVSDNKEYECLDGEFKLIPYDDFLDEKLKPAKNEKIGLIMKKHLANGEVVALSQHYFIAKGEFENPEINFNTADNIYEELFKGKNNRIQYNFSPVMPTKDKRDILGSNSSKALLLIRYEVFSDDKLIIFSKNFYDTNKISIGLIADNK